MIWFIGTFITITIDYNSSQSVAAYNPLHPYRSTSVFPSTMPNDEQRTLSLSWVKNDDSPKNELCWAFSRVLPL
jgi:hypothetical protein